MDGLVRRPLKLEAYREFGTELQINITKNVNTVNLVHKFIYPPLLHFYPSSNEGVKQCYLHGTAKSLKRHE